MHTHTGRTLADGDMASLAPVPGARKRNLSIDLFRPKTSFRFLSAEIADFETQIESSDVRENDLTISVQMPSVILKCTLPFAVSACISYDFVAII